VDDYGSEKGSGYLIQNPYVPGFFRLHMTQPLQDTLGLTSPILS